MKRAWVEINLEDLKSNYLLAKELAREKEILGVVKGNGYGCGAVAIAKALKKMGVKIFGVACLKEGIELRNAGIKEEILIFGAIGHDEYSDAFNSNLQITISTYKDIEYIEKNNFLNPKVHLKVDTGMGRIGFQNFKREDLVKIMQSSKKMKVVGVYSHFSCSDVYVEDLYTNDQIRRFREFEDIEELKYRHIQNSAGIILDNDKCYGNLARAGIMLYGFSDLHPDLKPIIKLKSRISHLKIVEQDSYISYGKEGFIKKGGMVATVSIGYADGYQRRFSNNGYMCIKGIPCKVLGKVCMDVTMLEIPKELENLVKIGTEVSILEKDIFEQLKNAQVSPYEYLVSITPRVEKVYLGKN